MKAAVHGVARASRAGLVAACLIATAALAVPGAAEAAHGESVAWNPDWHRFRTAEAALTGALLLPIAGALFVYPEPPSRWRGGVLFDDALRRALVASSADARASAARYGDALYYGLALYPLVVDTALVTWGVHGQSDVALEMLGMNLEAYALSGAIALTAQKLGRVRPAERGCRGDPSYSLKCEDPTSLNQSLLSGHTAIAFTGAGLTCAHHRVLPLYGGSVADGAACVVALASASVSGALRLVSDDHYATDVLLGAAVGLLSGYGIPTWLHYGSRRAGASRPAPPGSDEQPSAEPSGESRSVVALLPELSWGYAGLRVIGRH